MDPQQNEMIILLALEKRPELTRRNLCEKTGMPRTTVYDVLRRLTLKGLVESRSVPRPHIRGRRFVYYRLSPIKT